MARSLREAIASAITQKQATKEEVKMQSTQVGIKSQVVFVTPEKAKLWLVHNTHNRPLSIATVDKYAVQMRSGLWELNGEPIIFAGDGSLMSGQHRLHACIKADTGFQSIVITGIDRSTFATLDTHRRRTAGDVLTMEKAKNPTRLAAATRAYFRMLTNVNQSRQLTHQQYIEFIQAHPSLSYWCSFANTANKLVPGYTFGVIAAVEDVYGRDMAKDFYDRFVLGVNLKPTDPEYLLRQRFASRTTGARIQSELGLGLTIKAANLRLAGKTVKNLRYSLDEQFPQLLGLGL